MRPVTIADLRKIAGSSAPLAASLVGPINRYAPENGIDTPLLMAHFLCHMAHETKGFSTLEENLNYSVSGLLKTFGRHRISKADAQRLGRPDDVKTPLSLARRKAIANIIYGGKWGRENLGNTDPNDGWDFRGGGPYQNTGRANARKFGKAAGVDIENNPDIVRDPDTGVEVAAKYFASRMIGFARRDDIVGETKALNGGKLGLEERKLCLARGKQVFGPTRAAFAALPDDEDIAGPEDPPIASVPDDGDQPEAVVPIDLPISDPAVDEPRTVITNEGYTDAHQVELVQTWLRNLGYTEVGTPNGKLGAFTKGAIAAYRASKGMPPGQYIDDELILKLATDTEPRELPATRTDATPAEIRAKVPEAKATWISKISSNVMAVVSGVGAAISGLWSKIKDHLGEARDYLEPVRDFLGDVPTWVWFALVAGAAYLLSRQLHAGEKASIEAFKDGSRR